LLTLLSILILIVTSIGKALRRATFSNPEGLLITLILLIINRDLRVLWVLLITLIINKY